MIRSILRDEGGHDRRGLAQGGCADGADWFVERSAAQDHDALFDYRARAPHAALMHPTDEHLLPWYVAAGAGHEGPAVRLHDSVTVGCLGMDAYAFGRGTERLREQLPSAVAAPA